MLIYNFNDRGSCSKYEYLYQCLKRDILSGKLSENTRLPAKRALAEENHISITTVVNAYDQLLMEGYVYAKERSGYYVASDFTQKIRYQKLILDPPAPEEEEHWRVDFRANSIVYEKFPFSTWSRTMKQVLSDYHISLMKRGEFLGSWELRVEIAKYLYRNRGMTVSPENIVIGTGIEYLYSKLIRLLPRDAVYTVENPGYRKIPLIYDSFGVRWVCTEMDSSGIHMEDLLASDATVVHVSPEHHYPLGTSMTSKRRQELLRWLDAHQERYIIEDDYDWEFRYQGRVLPSLYGMDHSGRVIYMNTFSKTMSPAIRISYMVLPGPLMEKFQRELGFYSCTVPSFEQYTLARFLSRGFFEKHINRMRKFYKNRRNALISQLRSWEYGDRVEIFEQDSGLHFILRLKTALPDQALGAMLRPAGLRCLTDFYHQPGHRDLHCLLVNYAGLQEGDMEKICLALGAVFQNEEDK